MADTGFRSERRSLQNEGGTGDRGLEHSVLRENESVVDIAIRRLKLRSPYLPRL